jgi:hypothetical protein
MTGISEYDRHDVFDPFAQETSSRGRDQLGLAIQKKVEDRNIMSSQITGGVDVCSNRTEVGAVRGKITDATDLTGFEEFLESHYAGIKQECVSHHEDAPAPRRKSDEGGRIGGQLTQRFLAKYVFAGGQRVTNYREMGTGRRRDHNGGNPLVA